jgi:ABC-2 type transport system permease protein
MMLALVFAVPPVLCILFCLLYGNGMVRGVPIALCDNDNSEISGMLGRSLRSSGVVTVVEDVQNASRIEREIRSGRIQGGVVFPSGLESDLKRGLQAHPVVYRNFRNIMIGNYLYKECQTVFRTYNAGVLIKKLRMAGMSDDQAIALVNPIRLDVSNLYNPNFSYAQAMSPGLFFAQFQVIIMLSALLIVAHEREKGTLASTLAIARNSKALFLAGKSIPYLVAHFATAVVTLGVLFPLFSIKLPGSFAATLAVTVLFIIACFVPGLAIGSCVRDTIFGAQVAIFINMPAFIFSGFTFPSFNFPKPYRVLSQLMPFTHFANAFFKIALIKEPLRNAIPEALALSWFVIVPFIAAVVLLAWQTRAREPVV